jgi:hypothetical protein
MNRTERKHINKNNRSESSTPHHGDLIRLTQDSMSRRIVDNTATHPKKPEHHRQKRSDLKRQLQCHHNRKHGNSSTPLILAHETDLRSPGVQIRQLTACCMNAMSINATHNGFGSCRESGWLRTQRQARRSYLTMRERSRASKSVTGWWRPVTQQRHQLPPTSKDVCIRSQAVKHRSEISMIQLAGIGSFPRPRKPHPPIHLGGQHASEDSIN